MKGKDLVNGSFMFLNLNGVNLAQIINIDAKTNIGREDVKFSGKISVESKIVSSAGTGTFEMYKINNTLRAQEALATRGIDMPFSIRAYAEDPDNGGVFDVLYPECFIDGDISTFTGATGEIMKKTVSFRYVADEIIDTSR